MQGCQLVSQQRAEMAERVSSLKTRCDTRCHRVSPGSSRDEADHPGPPRATQPRGRVCAKHLTLAWRGDRLRHFRSPRSRPWGVRPSAQRALSLSGPIQSPTAALAEQARRS